MKNKSFQSLKFIALAAAISQLGGALFHSQALAQSGGVSYNGRATVVNVSDIHDPAPNPIDVCDTGPLPKAGGSLSVSFGSGNIHGGIGFSNASATTSGQNNQSTSVASVQNLTLIFSDMIGGAIHTLTTTSISANASANCTSSGVTVDGSSQITGLTIDGQAITVTGAVNQTINFNGFTVVLNERSNSVAGSTGALSVTALEVSEQGCMDALLATAQADINSSSCPPSVGPEFGLGPVADTTGLELGPSQVSSNGPAGGVLGDVYIAPGGEANFSGGGESLTGNVRLRAGATYQNSGRIVQGSVHTDQNLSAQIDAAHAACSNAVSQPCTQSIATLAGQNVTRPSFGSCLELTFLMIIGHCAMTRVRTRRSSLCSANVLGALPKQTRSVIRQSLEDVKGAAADGRSLGRADPYCRA
jgi:hypothetical protein